MKILLEQGTHELLFTLHSREVLTEEIREDIALLDGVEFVSGGEVRMRYSCELLIGKLFTPEEINESISKLFVKKEDKPKKRRGRPKKTSNVLPDKDTLNRMELKGRTGQGDPSNWVDSKKPKNGLTIAPKTEEEERNRQRLLDICEGKV